MKEQEKPKPKTIKQNLKCPNCGKPYRMSWTLANHEKICKERSKAIEKNPERYF